MYIHACKYTHVSLQKTLRVRFTRLSYGCVASNRDASYWGENVVRGAFAEAGGRFAEAGGSERCVGGSARKVRGSWRKVLPRSGNTFHRRFAEGVARSVGNLWKRCRFSAEAPRKHRGSDTRAGGGEAKNRAKSQASHKALAAMVAEHVVALGRGKWGG